MASEQEFPPIWNAGFHEKTLDEIEDACVNKFPLSTVRGDLMTAFRIVIDTLINAGIKGNVWLDGSFVTQKINPSDIDFILVMRSEFFDFATAEQKGTVEVLVEGDLWERPFLCDTNYVILDGDDRPNQPVKFWRDRFGYSIHKRTAKGVVVVPIGKEDDPNEPDTASTAATSAS